MDKVRTFLAGKKTYLLAIAGALMALVAWSVGEMDTKTLIEALFAAAMGSTLRAGISKGSY